MAFTVALSRMSNEGPAPGSPPGSPPGIIRKVPNALMQRQLDANREGNGRGEAFFPPSPNKPEVVPEEPLADEPYYHYLDGKRIRRPRSVRAGEVPPFNWKTSPEEMKNAVKILNQHKKSRKPKKSRKTKKSKKARKTRKN